MLSLNNFKSMAVAQMFQNFIAGIAFALLWLNDGPTKLVACVVFAYVLWTFALNAAGYMTEMPQKQDGRGKWTVLVERNFHAIVLFLCGGLFAKFLTANLGWLALMILPLALFVAHQAGQSQSDSESGLVYGN